MKRLLLFLLIISFSGLKAQSSLEDSLKKVIDTSSCDTTKLISLLNLGELKYKDSPEEAITIWRSAANFATQAIDKARQKDIYNFLTENKAVAYNNIGLVFKRIGQIDSAVKNLKISHKLFKDAGLERDAAKALIYIGLTYRIAGKLDSAIYYYEKAASEASGKDTLITALSFNNIGYIYRVQGETDKALSNYQKAFELYKSINAQKYIPPTLNNMAGIFESKGDLAKAIEYYTKSLKIYEQLGYKEGIAFLYNNIGHLYQQLDDTTNAMKFYQSSFKISEELGNKVEQANTLKNIGTLYEGKGELKKAKNYYTKSYKLLKEAGEKKLQSEVGLMLGNLLSKEGKIREAEKFYSNSLRTFNEIGDKEGLAETYIKLANLYLTQGNMGRAKALADSAYNFGITLGFPAIQRDASEILFKIFYKQNRWKDALLSYMHYIKMRDSIANIENKKAAYKQQIKYEYEKQQAIEKAEHQKEIQLIKEREKRQRLVSLFIGITALLVFLFAIFLYSRLRLIREQKRIIEEQNRALQSQNRKIMDSINYAERIQHAVLGYKGKAEIKTLPPHFVLFKPKDIVSGDFYWFYNKNNFLYVAAADCTGHGVPGALMSMLGISFLNEIISHGGDMTPAEILDELREKIIKQLNQDQSNLMSDGMDISMVRINTNNKEIAWAGAHNPLWLARNGKITEYKPDKQTIGISHKMSNFTNHFIHPEGNDIIYLFSDGYYDQFGKKSGMKFMKKNFKTLLEKISMLPVDQQKSKLEEQLYAWKEDLPQTDDILVIGIKI